ncbi:MAG: hypothetical protein ACK4PH_23180, partial [Aquincola tertiaricarbonis]
TAVRAELALREAAAAPLPPPLAAAPQADPAQAILQRGSATDGTRTALQASLERVDIQRRVDGVLQVAQGRGSTTESLQSLDAGWRAASPAVQQALLADPAARALIESAASEALQPLREPPADAAGPQAGGLQAMTRLDELTAPLSPEVAARVVAAAVPGIDQAVQQGWQAGGPPFGPGGIEHLVTLLGRVAGTPAGDAAIQRVAELGVWNEGGVIQAVAQGANPAYAVALARQPGIDGERVMAGVQTGVSLFHQKVADDTDAYAKQMDELAWLVQSHGGSMTPQQLEQAIADYTQARGADWQAQTAAMKQQLADNGRDLLAQLQALPADDPVAAEVLNDPKAQLAISTALGAHPELAQGPAGQQLLGWFTSSQFASNAKLTDQARKLVSEVATAHVQSTVLARIGDFDASDPASVARARAAIESLRSPALSRAWGVSDSALDKALKALDDAVPVAGESAEEGAARLRGLDQALGKISGFDKSTIAGQLLRGAGLGLAGVGLLASLERAGLDPSLRNQTKVLVDAAGLGQKGAELLVGLGKADTESLVGRLGSTAASRFLSVLTAAVDVWSAADAFGQGDIPSGVLYGVGAGGGLMAAFGAGSIAGPIGIGLVVVSVVGLAIWNDRKQANRHEPGSDGGTSLRFLQHAGFSEPAARALVNQSGDGHSVVPLLARHAGLHGLDLQDPAQHQRFVDWINQMPPERLAALRDNLHRTIDEFEGDAGRLPATTPEDAWIVRDTEQRPWFAVSGAARPESAAQIDAVLRVLELPLPPAG